MQTQRRGALAMVSVLLVGIVVAGFVVLASAGGPVGPVSESTRSISPRPLPTFTQNQSAPSAPTATPTRQLEPTETPAWLKALWQAVVYLAIAALVVFLGLVIFRILRRVRLPQAEPEDADWERMKTARLAEAVDSGLAQIDSGTATDAVIACWVALEEAAASAGVPRDPSETPAEFTVRVLGIGGISEPQLIGLGELYREARYSTHGSSEQARTEARAALRRLRDELAHVRPADVEAST
ncbi:DUF4129 domain-containing protein [Kribbella shirazensis]|uniref:Protein-glutamine gamma-glutamyltransferase-like C-terminal domain-containing protein n=1 Tax=Kribbella shirazensis TaxID=1105143 RepID=A0A7X5VJ53_9ACTN|nr:DUF4129 domain-containing protein [Kribbella shirazensis]NIK62202.1 hypothetical protein [Kribbella shirazensis]